MKRPRRRRCRTSMCRFVCIVFLSPLVWAAATTQAVQDFHLEPLDAGLTEIYRHAVHRALLPEARSVQSAVLVMPSFRPEWVAWIESTPRACTRAAPHAIWNGAAPDSPNTVPVTIPPVCAPISATLAEDLRISWRSQLGRTRQPDPSDTVGMDGTTYVFLQWSSVGHPIAGNTWSPYAESPMGRLVATALLLRRLVLAPSPELEIALCKANRAILPLHRRLTRRCS